MIKIQEIHHCQNINDIKMLLNDDLPFYLLLLKEADRNGKCWSWIYENSDLNRCLAYERLPGMKDKNRKATALVNLVKLGYLKYVAGYIENPKDESSKQIYHIYSINEKGKAFLETLENLLEN